MTDNKINTERKPDPFISQNVWLKRLGLIILLGGMGYAVNPIITTIVITLAIVAYFIKQIKGFFGSLWNS